MYTKFLGVKVDKIGLDKAFEESLELLKKPGKHLIVTTNVEFIMKAQKDPEFRNILNSSDLSLPDSSRFTWADAESKSRRLRRVLLWPFFFTNRVPGAEPFPVATGVDLMEKLVAKSGDYGFTIGLIGGSKGVADKAAECLRKKYPKAKIIFAEDGGQVDEEGNSLHTSYSIPNIDFLFIAFGQVKQEKWIEKNKDKIGAKVFMGVGGAFDYLSGDVKRAPGFLRALGLEWLYRLWKQPWRAKRFLSLIKFTFLILGS